jgi:molybdenum cofactor biosynthesis enzyme MoaA
MDKKLKKKKMFVMKETLVDLTPHLLGEVQGATDCTTVTNWQLSNGGTCNPCLVDQNTQLRTVIAK